VSNKECYKAPDYLWTKAILYRIIRMIIVFLSSWIVLNDTSTALSIMSVDVLAATIFYYVFDKSWPAIANWITHIKLKIKYRI